MDVNYTDMKLFKQSARHVQKAVAETHRFLYGGDRYVADDSLPANAFERVAGLAVYLHEIGAMGQDLSSAVIEAVDRYKARLLIEYKTVEDRDAFYIQIVENQATHGSPPGSPRRTNPINYSPHKRGNDMSSSDDNYRSTKVMNGAITDAVLYNSLENNSASTGAWWNSVQSMLPPFRNLQPQNVTARRSFAETEAKLRNNNGEPTITRELFDKFVEFVYSDFMPTMGIAMAGAWFIGQQMWAPAWPTAVAGAYSALRLYSNMDSHYSTTTNNALMAARTASIATIGPVMGQFLLVRNRIANITGRIDPYQMLPDYITRSIGKFVLALGADFSTSGNAIGDLNTYEAFRMLNNTAPMRNISAMFEIAADSLTTSLFVGALGLTAIHFGANYNATVYDKPRIQKWVEYNSLSDASNWVQDCSESVGYAGTSPEFYIRPDEVADELNYKVTERHSILLRLNNALRYRKNIANDSSKREVAGIDKFIIVMNILERDICALLDSFPAETDPNQKVNCRVGSSVVDQVFADMQTLRICNRIPRVLM